MMKAPRPTLDHIQSRLYRLWTNRAERAQYFEQNSAGAIADALTASIDAKGVKLYSSLIEIGRMDLMSSIYPVLKKLVGKQFKPLVLDYYEQLPPNHYNLNQAASRFSSYLLSVEKLLARYPFISELADYEWIELAVLEHTGASACDVGLAEGADADPERFAALAPVLNQAFICRRYKYAIPQLVQQINDDEKLPRRFKQVPTYVVVYRDPETLDARFLEVGEISLALLEKLQENPGMTYGALIQTICAEHGGTGKKAASVQSLLTGCLEAIEQFKNLGLIIGES
ncbi:MAG: putative DNA-binding domain-containing protein [Cyanobacteria bacterium SZAS LIN-3]|nr:putative DNA-binding domain-containing protein [Cyanobacteria bacterium SZAS LIN-3]